MVTLLLAFVTLQTPPARHVLPSHQPPSREEFMACVTKLQLKRPDPKTGPTDAERKALHDCIVEERRRTAPK